MPAPALPSALVTVPLTVTVLPAVAGLGFTVSVMVAAAAATVREAGPDVLPVSVPPAAGVKVDVTVYVPGAPGAGKTSLKLGPLTGNV